MENEKLLRALGLCAKAGRLVCGTPLVCEAVRSAKRPHLVLEASDNAPNTAKRIADKCTYYRVERVTLPIGGDLLSEAIGKTGRVAVVAITDPNLCQLVQSTLEKHS